jgi:hypothetical protein
MTTFDKSVSTRDKGKMTTFDKSVSTRSVNLDCHFRSVMIHVLLLSEGNELEEMTVTL